MKHYAVLFVPEFRLQATLRYHPQLNGMAVALLESLGKKTVVSELNRSAIESRIEVGMSATQALARCEELQLVSANAGHERAAQEALLQAADQLSPFFEITLPGVITIELPSEKRFGEKQLFTSVVEPLGRLGLTVRIGVASTPFLAQLASRLAEPVRIAEEANSFLNPLSINYLHPSEEIGGVLRAWGIRTIGDLTALPQREVGERLGPEVIALWERATGGRSRPLKLVKAREFFSEQTDLECPVEMLEPLLFLLRQFLEQITTRVGQVYLVVGKLRLILRFENGSCSKRIFTIPQPTLEIKLLFRMLQTYLENFTSDSPIIGLELAAQPVRAAVEQFGLLENGVRDPHQLSETLARLQALLGTDRVGTPEVERSHHPQGFHLRPYDPQATAGSCLGEPLLGLPSLRFHSPIPARITLTDRQPSFIQSTRTTGPIHGRGGPWLLGGNWWEPTGWAREEWDIKTDTGLYRLVNSDRQWFLEGVYV